MIEPHLLTTDDLLIWLNADGRLRQQITYPKLIFWLQSRRVPVDRKHEGRNQYAIETATELAEMILAHQLLRSTIKWRPARGTRRRWAKRVSSSNQ